MCVLKFVLFTPCLFVSHKSSVSILMSNIFITFLFNYYYNVNWWEYWLLVKQFDPKIDSFVYLLHMTLWFVMSHLVICFTQNVYVWKFVLFKPRLLFHVKLTKRIGPIFRQSRALWPFCPSPGNRCRSHLVNSRKRWS